MSRRPAGSRPRRPPPHGRLERQPPTRGLVEWHADAEVDQDDGDDVHGDEQRDERQEQPFES